MSKVWDIYKNVIPYTRDKEPLACISKNFSTYLKPVESNCNDFFIKCREKQRGFTTLIKKKVENQSNSKKNLKFH